MRLSDMRFGEGQSGQIIPRNVPQLGRPLATMSLWLGSIAAISWKAAQEAVHQQWVVFALLIVCALGLILVLIITSRWDSDEDVNDTIVNVGHGLLLIWAIFLTVEVIISGIDHNWQEFGLELFAALWSWGTLFFARLGIELPDPTEFGVPP